MLTAILRTVVPALWGSFIAWLIGLLPVLSPLEADLLGMAEIILPIVTAVIIGAWYALWRWLEPRLPDWLTRAVLGSAKTPVYDRKATATVTANINIQSASDPEVTAQEIARRIKHLDI